VQSSCTEYTFFALFADHLLVHCFIHQIRCIYFVRDKNEKAVVLDRIESEVIVYQI
jgi:hypothetical protein